MERVDFLGSPATGKTTLFREIFRQRTKKDAWMTPEEALSAVAIEYALQNGNSFKNICFASILKTGFFKKIHPSIKGRILNPYRLELVWKRMKGYADFFEVALEGGFVVEEVEPFFKAFRISWFYQIADEVIFLEQINRKGLVLYDESLSHKVFDVLLSRKKIYKKLVEKYFKSMPLPRAVISCELSADEVFNRTRKKDRLPYVQRGLSDDQLFEMIQVQCGIAEIGADILGKRGVSVVEVDMSQELKANAIKIADILKEMI